MQKKDCIEIKKCRLCNSIELDVVFNVGRTPLANSYSNKRLSEKLKEYPLGLNLCNSCGHLQLTNSIKPTKMFSNYLYKTNTSNKNYLHFQNYAKEINILFKKKKGKVLDIASNDGTFLNFFDKKKYFRLGVDPAKNLKKIAERKGLIQIDKFFTKKLSKNVKKKYQLFDIITANHVCAHVENLNDFFQGVKNLLKKDGIFVFEISYRWSVLKNNTFDIIYHEHLDYHALFPLLKFLKKFDLKIFDFKITKAQGGSIRVYTSMSPPKQNIKKIKKQILKEKNNYKLFKKKTYIKFVKKINSCKNKLLKIFSLFEKKKLSIVGYGAAAKTTTLLNYFDLSKNSKIRFIFDDNNLKQNLYLPGTNIKILNPKFLRKIKINIIVIFAWNYSDVIINKIRKDLRIDNKNIKFLIPFPNPKIV